MITARKGGVCKTTITVNLAYTLARLGKKVLIIDLDAQADSTKFYRAGRSDFYIGDVLLERKFDIRKAIYKAQVKGEELENLHIIPGRPNDEMTVLDRQVFSLSRSEERLTYQLNKLDTDEYDFLLIDTSPTATTLSMNATMACDEFLFPTDFTGLSLDGIDSIIEHIQDLKLIEEDEINFLVVPSSVDKKSVKTVRYGEEYIAAKYPDNRTKTVIWQKPAIFNEAVLRFLPIAAISNSDISSIHYKELAQEVLDNVL